MKNFESQPLLLLFMVTLVIAKHSNGSHTLRFVSTFFSWPRHLDPQFILLIYVDETLIMGFNSISESQRMESRVPWLNELNAEFWEFATQGALKEKNLMAEIMNKLLHIYNDSMAGYHIIQETYGCQVKQRMYFSHAFMELVLDTHDYITLNEDLQTWRAVGKAAEILKEVFEKVNLVKSSRSFLLGACVEGLLHYLNFGKKYLLRTDPPEPTIPFMPMIIALVLGALLMGAVMTFLIWKRRTRG
ncbi:H-2 class I histocompatibility antigen, Q10 alpha chain-like isoform X2 [Mus caroli]|uniref:H-2 class I histocompatibility antigen, Q10 alpha chain-like isoform X2 n=1 Tax=Mus caroli TaxID=10089 RepID=A0A6P5P7E9_MUSCR|nr:H-2 class I histocompatibility antigen, Q10 alpha chain-like isoform X2 [Mus caroli]